MLAEIIGIVVNIAKQILACTEIIGYRYQNGTPASTAGWKVLRL